jgi:hypothetical protein
MYAPQQSRYQNMKYIGLVFLLYKLLAPSVNASTLLQIDTMQLANDAALVFEGEVVFTQTDYIQGGNIYTLVDFLITDVLQGQLLSGQIITLRFTGGVVDNLKLDIGSRIPALYERGIYFVEAAHAQLANPLLGWSQGHFIIQADGTLLAGNNQLVVDVKPTKNKAEAISHGVARGIKTIPVDIINTKSSKENSLQAMSVAAFKRQFKNIEQPK